VFRFIGRLIVLALLVFAGFVAYTYYTGNPWRPGDPILKRDGGPIDTDAARAKGAEVADQAIKAAGQLEEKIGEGTLTAKIKAKMALDDMVAARDINVDTAPGAVVTLKGTVKSQTERERAVRLATETNGVKKVVDQLQIKP
jgi:hypothetical protein